MFQLILKLLILRSILSIKSAFSGKINILTLLDKQSASIPLFAVTMLPFGVITYFSYIFSIMFSFDQSRHNTIGQFCAKDLNNVQSAPFYKNRHRSLMKKSCFQKSVAFHLQGICLVELTDLVVHPPPSTLLIFNKFYVGDKKIWFWFVL